MGPIEIVTIILAVLIVVGVLAAYIVRKVKGKPTGDCAGCPYAGDCKHGGGCGSHQHVDLSQYKKDNDGKSDNSENN